MFTKAIEKITQVATKLDELGKTETANAIDKVTGNLVLLKTAQYVGIQGYWIRNNRCWMNCYRQKRASQPSLGAQEVWTECQKEYEESINNPKSGWEKYAKGKDALRKFSSKAAQRYIKLESEGFTRCLKNKAANSTDIPFILKTSMQKREAEFETKIHHDIQYILNVANLLKERGHEELAKNLADASGELVQSMEGDSVNFTSGRETK